MSRLAEQYAQRKERAETLRASGTNPYPHQVHPTHRIGEAREQFSRLRDKKEAITIAGRIRALRLHGASEFLSLEDGTGSLQAYAKADVLGEAYGRLTSLVDTGDFVELTGTLFTTKRGEETLMVASFRLLTKSLYPLPEKWHGLKDVEIRYRKRELDLLANPEVKELFLKRAAIITSIRAFLDREGFLEVHTPILQPIAGGATARPFVTHHHALDTDLYLRIAPELYLKRLIVGGFPRVYDLGPCFRNEGMDVTHNPEFYQVEWYAAYWTLEDMMAATERLLVTVVHDVFGKEHRIGSGQFVLKAPFVRLDFREAFQTYAHIDTDDHPTATALVQAAAKEGWPVTDVKKGNRGKVLDAILKSAVRPHLKQPTFLMNYPKDMSPLAKSIEGRPEYVHRFQLFIDGKEIANAFGELNDPLEQEQRFAAQERLRSEGDDEAQRTDGEFLDALRYGMPPTAGIGIGIERLVMLLTGVNSIKEVMLFPVLRPKTSTVEKSEEASHV